MLESQVCLVILLEVMAFFFFLHKTHICNPLKSPHLHLVSPESAAVKYRESGAYALSSA